MRRLNYILLLIVIITSAFHSGMLRHYPNHFPEPAYNFDKNPIIAEKVELGRALFYDPVLSRDSSISCASCHSPYNAFAHTDHDLSHGIHDRIGIRNAPPLFNLAWQSTFMWDGAINHLDMQALAPIHHPNEMDEILENVVNKLQRNRRYPQAFYQAFQDTVITGEYILKALSQFQLTLVSATAKYDSVKLGLVSFTEQEQKGYALFENHCNSCHTEPLFTNQGFANNGLAVDSTLNDKGRSVISGKKEDYLLFKIPSLRNISYSYPYMHDGRFATLREVIHHYSEKTKTGKTLSQTLKKPLSLHPNEKVDLTAFLLTLDDKAFVFDKKNKFPRDFFFGAKD